MESKFYFAIDRGGTFTDVYARCPGGKVEVLKLLSKDPHHYRDAPTEGIRRIMANQLKIDVATSRDIDTDLIGWIRMGTTVATNALLERKGERIALVVTKGFRDLLYIGNQARPNIFDLSVECADVLYEDVVEVNERVVPLQEDSVEAFYKRDCAVRKCVTGESVIVTEPLDRDSLRRDLQSVYEKGIRSLAVLLLHSYMFHEHERTVNLIAEEVGFTHVSMSSAVMPMVKAVARGYTACVDAYLTPHIHTYLKEFCEGFRDNLNGVNVLFMQSDGGLTQKDRFCGSRAILSGPAGGVVGFAMTAYDESLRQAVIGFDMGGTSTDVSRYGGEYEHVFETTTAGITLQAPQLDINTVAAGGGSRLFYRSGIFVVGPESVGAHPGPVCYRKGGQLALTDANLVLGRLLPQYFPKIFGPNEDQPLDDVASTNAFRVMLKQINEYDNKCQMSMTDVALGFVRVANEAMCRPIRALTQIYAEGGGLHAVLEELCALHYRATVVTTLDAKGHDTSDHILAVFGGAGGQHACAIARSLGMRKVLIHKYGGILSAFGMALADVVHEAQQPCCKKYQPDHFPYLDERLTSLSEECGNSLRRQGFVDSNIKCETFLNMRYDGTDCALMCSALPCSSGSNVASPVHGDFEGAFLNRYKVEFGFTIEDRCIIVDDIRVRGVGLSNIDCDEKIEQAVSEPEPCKVTKTWFEEGLLDTNVYLLEHLRWRHKVEGPAIIMDKLSTIIIEPDCSASVTERGDIAISIEKAHQRRLTTTLDSVQLSIFSHRFMSLAEQMGRILQRTSISTNIKERLDFSCAIFGADGGLVSNAPHIPVHLGAMQETVQYQLRTLHSNINPGDVLLSNHPCAGGSHLPDLTVITPVFRQGVEMPVFYVASRGHHADIGGITPGSMPPHSTSIHEEGAVFFSFKLVDGGVFEEEELIAALKKPAQIKGSSGTRNLKDNLSDLRAQVAANQKGIVLVNELIDWYGLDVVQAYMAHIQESAEGCVRQLLRNTAKQMGATVLRAHDYMDDGSLIQLQVTIDSNAGSAVFSFDGTTEEVWGNCNAPRAITVSAVIYCLRCLVGYDIPLNQGCLKPVQIIIPKYSLLDPSEDAAVVGGNVQTSQRVVDVILRAFGACAASQGCMNNVTFGDSSIGYYETVAGGAGAGRTWNGRSGIHTHMTNTRITDPEILERRYPVVLSRFSLRPGSGGKGKHRGGDGVVRELIFRRALTLSILTERRVFRPYGLEGGEDGARGNNLLITSCKRTIRLPSKTSVDVKKGDTFRLETPGGGGWGVQDQEQQEADGRVRREPAAFLKGSVHNYRQLQESA